MIFMKYLNIWPDYSHMVMLSIEGSYQKAIIDEFTAVGINVENLLVFNFFNSKGLDPDETIANKGALGMSMILVSSEGNQIQGLSGRRKSPGAPNKPLTTQLKQPTSYKPVLSTKVENESIVSSPQTKLVPKSMTNSTVS